jgi:glutathione S-transferase
MKLYYSPGACSLSPHIALREAELSFELVRVDLKTKVTESGEDFRKVNPDGYVPCLVLDDGRTLTEGPAIVQYVADQVPGKIRRQACIKPTRRLCNIAALNNN